MPFGIIAVVGVRLQHARISVSTATILVHTTVVKGTVRTPKYDLVTRSNKTFRKFRF